MDKIFSGSTPTLATGNTRHVFWHSTYQLPRLSVIAKILLDMNILRSKIGNLVLTAAMIDDFLGWILFSIIGVQN